MGSFVAACGLFVACRLLSSCGAWAPGCVGSVVVVLGFQSTWALDEARKLSSCGVRVALWHVGS